MIAKEQMIRMRMRMWCSVLVKISNGFDPNMHFNK